MTLQLRQTTHQRLMLAPNITLALEVLRMPTMELQTFLRQQVEENPLLEIDEPEEAEDGSVEEEPAEPAETGIDEEWAANWQQATSVERGNAEPDSGELDGFLEQQPAKPQSFHESLLLQLGCQPLSPTESGVGEALILRLDERGYLEGPLDALAVELQRPLPELEAALRLIQRLDPPGVGARDLRECLMLQLERAGADRGLAYRILRDHFPLFTQHHLTALAKATGSSVQEVEAACAELKRLDPKPGRFFSGDLPPCVVPDLVIVRRESHDDVELNDQAVPHLGLSRTYARMLRNPQTPEDAKVFLAAKFRQATWLIKAIEERNTTLLAIGRCLLSLQRAFVLQGPRALKPLTQAQVASLIGRHASTVSRAIAGKTLDTPYGIFRLEQLFPSGIHRPTGAPQPEVDGQVSDATIKEEIRRLIAEEDAHRPFSDEALARQLAERQLAVARRTVAKYRTALKILPAHLRRRRL
ncbi:MAG: RNA polymerase factor sigma-54 [Candidatus Omnitrophica bacterium]|nr:RNA polymerase factor sigma-54 [Candidatus Omnitrophota bacterium]